jgi:hypothetical protein
MDVATKVDVPLLATQSDLLTLAASGVFQAVQSAYDPTEEREFVHLMFWTSPVTMPDGKIKQAWVFQPTCPQCLKLPGLSCKCLPNY